MKITFEFDHETCRWWFMHRTVRHSGYHTLVEAAETWETLELGL